MESLERHNIAKTDRNRTMILYRYYEKKHLARKRRMAMNILFRKMNPRKI